MIERETQCHWDHHENSCVCSCWCGDQAGRERLHTGTRMEVECAVAGTHSRAGWCLRGEGALFLTASGIAVSVTSGRLSVRCGFVYVYVYVCVFSIEVDNET